MEHQSACKFCHEIFEDTDDYDKHFSRCSPEIAAEDEKHNPDHGVSEWEVPIETESESESILTPIKEPVTVEETGPDGEGA